MLKSIWKSIKRIGQSISEAQKARAEWELIQQLRLYGYKDLSHYQLEKLKQYERSNF